MQPRLHRVGAVLARKPLRLLPLGGHRLGALAGAFLERGDALVVETEDPLFGRTGRQRLRFAVALFQRLREGRRQLHLRRRRGQRGGPVGRGPQTRPGHRDGLAEQPADAQSRPFRRKAHQHARQAQRHDARRHLVQGGQPGQHEEARPTRPLRASDTT